MELSSILVAVIIMLGATAICVILSARLGFGAVLGFIVAGILIGPHTPGPVASHNVEGLQHVAELGVVLFMFAVGLEMRPAKMWSMRRLLFGLGSTQVLVTGAVLALYGLFVAGKSWEVAAIVGLSFAMSSTAIVMSTLKENGQLSAQHGQTSFAILMAQDVWIVPVLALVPILAHKTADTASIPLWEKALLVVGVVASLFVVGRYLVPAVLSYVAGQRRMEAFGMVVLLAVVVAAWAVERVGISMTLGAFMIGMLLSASDYRYQIEAAVEPFKETLMGLFFIAVGMSIDIDALVQNWVGILTLVPVVLLVKVIVVTGLALAFGVGRSAAIRAGFYMSQVGELAFVLLNAAFSDGLIGPQLHTAVLLVVAVSMVATPLMIKAGDRLADWLGTEPPSPAQAVPAADLDRHVVVIGYEEIGQLMCLLLEKANVPYVAFDTDYTLVRQGKRLGHNVHFGDMYRQITQEAAGLGRAAAAYVTATDMDRAKSLSVTVKTLYPKVKLYLRVNSLTLQDELAAQGVKRARTGYIESTLVNGAILLKDLGVSEEEVDELVNALHEDDYALVRARYAEVRPEAAD